eukprot:3849796-Pyramimonas_sp.AAC.1
MHEGFYSCASVSEKLPTRVGYRWPVIEVIVRWGACVWMRGVSLFVQGVKREDEEEEEEEEDQEEEEGMRRRGGGGQGGEEALQ